MARAVSKLSSDDVFQHALSHHVAHWAAYVAMMLALASMTAVLTTAATPLQGVRLWGTVWVISLGTVGALYFVRGMDTYGSVLCDNLPPEYLVRTQSFRHDMTITIGTAAALAAGVGNLLIIYFLVR